MGINIQAKMDVSYLFGSMGNGAAGVAGSNFLSDYASIKNGSYGKLMRAYYGKNSNEAVKSAVKNQNLGKTDAEKKSYAKVQTATDALKESADALLDKGSKSVFAMKDIVKKDENGVETTVKGYDTEGIYKAVSNFVNDYNSVIKSVNDADNDNIIGRTQSMVNNTDINSKMLSQIGITINEDATLSIDKDAFMKTDMSKVKNVFSGAGSYGYQVSAQASLINFSADREASRTGTYNFNGTYSNHFNNGNLFNSYF